MADQLGVNGAQHSEHVIGGGVAASDSLLNSLRLKLTENEELISRRNEEIASLGEQAEEIRGQISVLEQARKLFIANESEDGDGRDVLAIETAIGETCSTPSLEELQSCPFQYQAFVKIAEMNGGELVLSEAADLVIAARKPVGTRNSVLVTQRRRMKKSEDWERIDRGVYRLTKHRLSEDRDETDALYVTSIEGSSDEDTETDQQAA